MTQNLKEDHLKYELEKHMQQSGWILKNDKINYYAHKKGICIKYADTKRTYSTYSYYVGDGGHDDGSEYVEHGLKVWLRVEDINKLNYNIDLGQKMSKLMHDIGNSEYNHIIEEINSLKNTIPMNLNYFLTENITGKIPSCLRSLSIDGINPEFSIIRTLDMNKPITLLNLSDHKFQHKLVYDNYSNQLKKLFSKKTFGERDYIEVEKTYADIMHEVVDEYLRRNYVKHTNIYLLTKYLGCSVTLNDIYIADNFNTMIERNTSSNEYAFFPAKTVNFDNIAKESIRL